MRVKSGLLRSLHFANAWNTAQSKDHAIEVPQVFGINNKLHNRFAVLPIARFNRADIGVIQARNHLTFRDVIAFLDIQFSHLVGDL